jgi:hypothetical protein
VVALVFSNSTTWPIVPAAPELIPALTDSCADVQLEMAAWVVVVVVARCVVDVEVDVDGFTDGVLLHAATRSATAPRAATTVQRTR